MEHVKQYSDVEHVKQYSDVEHVKQYSDVEHVKQYSVALVKPLIDVHCMIHFLYLHFYNKVNYPEYGTKTCNIPRFMNKHIITM